MADPLSSDLASLKIERSPARPPRSIVGPLVSLVAVAGVAAAGYFAGVPYLEAKIYKTGVATTEIALVSPTQASTELVATGYVVPEKVSNVASKVVGRVVKVSVKRGDLVQEGDVLYELDQTDPNAAIASARSRVAAAKARAQTARANLVEAQQQAERERALVASGVSPKAKIQDLDARIVSLDQAVKASDAEAQAADAETSALSVNAKSYTVRTPIAGTIITKPPELGEFIGPAYAGMLGGVQVADLSTLVVEADVPEQRLYLVKVGGAAEIVLDAFPGKRFRGKITQILPQVNRSKATVTVKVGFVDPTEGVLGDMAARVSFLSAALDAEAVKEAPKLVVPASALADRGGAKVVFTVEGDTVRMTPVTVGGPAQGGFELVKGPGAGTRVVKDPPSGLADGQRIKEKTAE